MRFDASEGLLGINRDEITGGGRNLLRLTPQYNRDVVSKCGKTSHLQGFRFLMDRKILK